MISRPDRICRGAACFAVVCLLAITTVSASDCPDFGLSGKAQKQFCAEFQELLYAPYNPSNKRGNEDRRRLDLEEVLKSDPLWGEIYRSDPQKTLEMIDRIRKAGGLPQD